MNDIIYIIEDDKNIASIIEIALNSYSYKTYCFEKAEDAIKALNQNKPNLIIIDVMLPGIDGISAVYLIRKKLRYTPIILLTAKCEETDKIEGLTSGADDYITKPFSVVELAARVEMHLKKLEKFKEFNKDFEENLILSSNKKLKINLFSREVLVNETPIELTFKEYELLKYIVKNSNKAISREELLNKIWGYKYIGETRTIDIHIKTIRQKLGSLGDKIKTIRGVGYKFIDE